MPRLKDHPLYRTWLGMRERCTNPNKDNYKYYGGKGVTFAPEWDDFEAFVSDMGPRPPGHQLERSDSSGPYCKHNCCWASRIDQNNNKSSNVLIPFKGEHLTVPTLARRVGLQPRTLWARLKRGWSIEKALTCPLK